MDNRIEFYRGLSQYAKEIEDGNREELERVEENLKRVKANPIASLTERRLAREQVGFVENMLADINTKRLGLNQVVAELHAVREAVKQELINHRIALADKQSKYLKEMEIAIAIKQDICMKYGNSSDNWGEQTTKIWYDESRRQAKYYGLSSGIDEGIYRLDNLTVKVCEIIGD